MTDDKTASAPRQWFRAMIQERRIFPSGSLDWQWRTNAARKFLHLLRGVPAKDW